MAKVIVKFKYYKPNDSKNMGGYAKYIATREGVEKVKENSKTYADYIATRPGVEKTGAHGLFSSGNEKINLAKVSRDLNKHTGNIWTFIISLKREDAERLGYDNAKRWKEMLGAQIDTLSKTMNIPIEDLNWYAAFHNEGHHPHVHMIVYSKNPKEGFMTEKGLSKFRMSLYGGIFENDDYEIYVEKTKARNEVKEVSKEKVEEIINTMKATGIANDRIENLMMSLADKLSKTQGKKVYGYLKPDVKLIADAIVDELEKDCKVKELYDLWYQKQEAVTRAYTSNLPNRLMLSQNKEFKSIKNMVIRSAMELVENQITDAGTQQFAELSGNNFAELSGNNFAKTLGSLAGDIGNLFREKINDDDMYKFEPHHRDQKTYRKRQLHGLKT